MDCPFCSIVSGKTPSLRIFENDSFMAVLDIKPANPGHFILFPKKHIPFLTEMDAKDRGMLFELALKLSEIVVPVVKAEGFNILYSAGKAAGQVTPHMILHVIPRFKDDKVKLEWEPSGLSEGLYKKIISSLQKNVKETRKEGKKKDESIKQTRKLPGYW
jgi:histidine triad (HIT) family protein